MGVARISSPPRAAPLALRLRSRRTSHRRLTTATARPCTRPATAPLVPQRLRRSLRLPLAPTRTTTWRSAPTAACATPPPASVSASRATLATTALSRTCLPCKSDSLEPKNGAVTHDALVLMIGRPFMLFRYGYLLVCVCVFCSTLVSSIDGSAFSTTVARSPMHVY